MTADQLREENEDLRARLEEAEETLRAIRSGSVDAVVVGEAGARRVYTLDGADRAYRVWVEQMSQGAATLYPDGTVAYCNLRLETLLGVPCEDLAGRPLRNSVAPDDQSRYDELLQEGRSGKAGQAEFDLIRGDDSPVPVFLTINALPPESGVAMGILVTDLTSQRHHEELAQALNALRESEDRAAFVRRSGGVGFWYCDLPFDVLQWDELVKAHFHLPADAHVTIDLFYARLHTDDREPTRAAIERSIRDHVPYNMAYRTVDPHTKAEKWVQAIGRTTYDDNDTPIRFDGITMDVTAEKRSEEERNRLYKNAEEARAEAEAANRMKDEFLATLSHELRTPLNAIVGWTKILRSSKVDDEDRAEGLEVIDRNAMAQAQLIEDLLDISRIVSGKLTLDVQRVNLVEIIERALDAVMPTAKAKEIRVQKILDSLAGAVSGDPARLQQVVWNLLTNAVKFTPRGGKVQVLLERVNSHVEISVIDTGQGIHPDFLPHVFDRFRQADGSTTRAHGGLGLGLSIVKQLVEMHGGSVRVKSPGEGQGSTFTVVLPITILHSDQPAKVPPKEAEHVEDEDVCGGNDLKGLRVLVVDDEPDACALMKRVLKECGAEVQSAGSAQEGLRLVEDFRPHVLVSDVGMPEQDGYDLIRQVRQRLSARDLPAVALTAYARSEDRLRAMRAGFQVHVTKPVDPEELVAVVATLAARTGGAVNTKEGDHENDADAHPRRR